MSEIPFLDSWLSCCARQRTRGHCALSAMLTVSQLSKSFAGRALFDDVSLQVNRGDRIGLVGPNGAGKSTLFALLLGDVSPDNGTIAIEKNATIGFLPQETAATGDETVLELALAVSDLNLSPAGRSSTTYRSRSIGAIGSDWLAPMALANRPCLRSSSVMSRPITERSRSRRTQRSDFFRRKPRPPETKPCSNLPSPFPI